MFALPLQGTPLEKQWEISPISRKSGAGNIAGTPAKTFGEALAWRRGNTGRINRPSPRRLLRIARGCFGGRKHSGFKLSRDASRDCPVIQEAADYERLQRTKSPVSLFKLGGKHDASHYTIAYEIRKNWKTPILWCAPYSSRHVVTWWHKRPATGADSAKSIVASSCQMPELGRADDARRIKKELKGHAQILKVNPWKSRNTTHP